MAKAEGGPGDRVGTVIKGKWTIESLLGVGGMASVYAASHRNGQRAALKILHTDFAREKTICDRFLREAYVSNKVNHPATVQVLDDDMTESGEPFLIMELLEGETVRDAWKKSGRTMPVPRVMQISERVLDCLSSCHAIGVIHRDLKPANIFITNAGVIKVLDFGVAQMRDATAERTATGTALGTPAYMSPEQAMGLVDQLDGRADLFSVGAMMHALITGHRINNGRTEQEALVMAATKPVPSVARIAPNLPIDVIQVVDKSLAWDRRNRYGDAREMQAACLEVLAKTGTEALSSGQAPRPNEVVAPPPPPIPTVTSKSTAQPASAAAVAIAVANQPEPAPRKQTAPVAGKQSLGFGGAAAVPATTKASIGFGGTPAGQNFPPIQLDMPPSRGGTPAGQPSPVHGGMQPGAKAPEALENDPRVQGLRDLMKHVDRLLPNVRQFGWAHPATERSLRTGFEAFSSTLVMNRDLVNLQIRPYSFMTLGQTVWEPGAPFDAIPYNLFACGMRSLRIDAGVTLDEFRDLFQLLMLDPGRDLPPEDDLAAALWEKGLDHVKYDLVDAFAEGDAAEREAFYGEADELEAQAEEAARSHVSNIEARAMNVSTDRNALSQSRVVSPFALDEKTKSVVLQHFDMNRELWSDRYVDALMEGLLDAAQHRDAPLMLTSLRKSAADLAVVGRLEIVVRLHQALVERLTGRINEPQTVAALVAGLTNAMFGGETLDLMLKRLREDPAGVDAFVAVLGMMSANELPSILRSLREGHAPNVRNVLAQFVERALPGREAEVAQAAIGTDPDTASILLRILGRAQTMGARQILSQLAQHEDVNVRIEARVMMSASPEQAQNEVNGLIENQNVFVRLAALRAAIRFGLRGSWPNVARAVNAKGFPELGSDERRELLRALLVLSPERGEPIALELAKKGGVLVSGEREATRALAAEVLGDCSRAMSVAHALNELAQTRWGISEETRQAAGTAAKKIASRVEMGGQPAA
jgi:serine/threonine protein kinase